MNVEDLVKLSDVMMEHNLGPNGGKPSISLAFIFVLDQCFEKLVDKHFVLYTTNTLFAINF